MAEKLRVAIESEPWPVMPITVSLGVGEVRKRDTPDLLIGRVDQALYRAKEEGRNRVSASPHL